MKKPTYEEKLYFDFMNNVHASIMSTYHLYRACVALERFQQNSKKKAKKKTKVKK